MDIISYWCTDCGKEMHYPNCDSMEVYIRCPRCSNVRPVLFVENRLLMITILDNTRRTLTMRLAVLTGNSDEDMISNPGRVIGEYIEAQEKKERNNAD